MKIAITYEDVPFTIECTFRPGTPDTWHEQGAPEEFEIEKVSIGEHEVGSLISATTERGLRELANVAAREQWHDDREAEQIERAEAQIERLEWFQHAEAA